MLVVVCVWCEVDSLFVSFFQFDIDIASAETSSGLCKMGGSKIELPNIKNSILLEC